jgi:hypothetical protein
MKYLKLIWLWVKLCFVKKSKQPVVTKEIKIVYDEIKHQPYTNCKKPLKHNNRRCTPCRAKTRQYIMKGKILRVIHH